jgi:transposase
MRALEPEVVNAVWAAVEPLLPEPPKHPLGCHRPRVPDRLCFWGILVRLTTGSSWVDIEAILEHRVSDTTLRARRDEWIAAGVFDKIRAEAVAAFDRIKGLDLSEVAIDGSLHKAPYGGQDTGRNPCDRGKLGWKWSIAVDRHGIPLGWSIDAANRHDTKLLQATISDLDANYWTAEIETVHLDRGYDFPVIRRMLTDANLGDHVIQRRKKAGETKPQPMRLGLRWIVEAANSWLTNYGQLRRNTDRKTCHRHAALCLATTILIVGKLISYRDRWSPDSAPIR